MYAMKKILVLGISVGLSLQTPMTWAVDLNSAPSAPPPKPVATPQVQTTAGQQLSTANQAANSNKQAQDAGKSAGNGMMMAGIGGAICAGLAAMKYMDVASDVSSCNAGGAGCAKITPDTIMAVMYTAGTILAVMVAMNESKAKKQAGDSQADLSPTAYNIPGSESYANDPTQGSDTTESPGSRTGIKGDVPVEVARKIAQAKADLAKAGVKADFDKGTFTTPDGKTYNAQSVASGSAGLPGGSKAFDEMMSGVAKEAKKQMGNSEFDNGGGAPAARVVDASYPDTPAAAPTDNAKKNDPTKGRNLAAAGAAVIYNGEKIGASADFLFNIVCRRVITEVERGSTMEAAVGRKPVDCDTTATAPISVVPASAAAPTPKK